MAEDKDLIFPMHLDIDVQNFEKDWLKAEPKLQAILDKNALKAKIDVDYSAIQKSLELLTKMQEIQATSGSLVKPSSAAAMLTAETKQRIMLENQAIKAKQ